MRRGLIPEVMRLMLLPPWMPWGVRSTRSRAVAASSARVVNNGDGVSWCGGRAFGESEAGGEIELAGCEHRKLGTWIMVRGIQRFGTA